MLISQYQRSSESITAEKNGLYPLIQERQSEGEKLQGNVPFFSTLSCPARSTTLVSFITGKKFYSHVRFLFLTLVPVLAIAATGDIDPAKSTLTATFKQEGVAVDAPFKKFSGHIVYDAKNVAASSAMIDVQTASFDMGSDDYNNEVRGKEWFDSATYPDAVFKSSAIKADGANKFTASGTLTIKGKSVNLSVPVNVQTANGISTFDGSIAISRAAFGIGDPSWKDVIEDKVTVRFHLVNTK